MRFAGFAFLAVSLLPGLAQAGTREDVSEGVGRCAGIADDRLWLECFYGAAQPMRAQLGLPPAPEAQTRLSRSVASAAPHNSSGGWFSGMVGSNDRKAPAREFGLPPPPAELGNVDRVVARMTEFSFNQYGTFTATLSNGQVWRQLSDDTTHAMWTRKADKFDYAVTVSRGALGSFNFRVAKLPGLYKVARVR